MVWREQVLAVDLQRKSKCFMRSYFGRKELVNILPKVVLSLISSSHSKNIKDSYTPPLLTCETNLFQIMWFEMTFLAIQKSIHLKWLTFKKAQAEVYSNPIRGGGG